MTREMSSMSVSFKMQGSLKNVLDDGSGSSIQHPGFSFTKAGTVLSSGIEDNQANRAWQSEGRELASGASETLDLYDLAGVDIGAGAGMDGVGQAVEFEEIVFLAIVNDNDAGEDGALEIEPAAANGWTPIATHTVATGGALYGQGVLLMLQLDGRGFDVEDGVSHQITLTANGDAVEYSIYVLGRHDDEVSSSSSSSASSSSSSSSSMTSSSSSMTSSSSSQSA